MFSKLGFACVLSFSVLCAGAFGQVTKRASVGDGGVQPNGHCEMASISADGRCVAFVSWATNLFPGDSNAERDVFVHDRVSGATELVDVNSNGVQANGGASYHPGASPISADGRFVVYTSWASNLVPGDANGMTDAFLRDRQNGTTELASVATNGSQGDGASYVDAVSADGRYVAFASYATNFGVGDTRGHLQAYVRDRLLGTTECVSVDANNDPGDGNSDDAVLSPDGRYVVFDGTATNLVVGDTNGEQDVFIRDRQTATTERVSIHTFGFQANGSSSNGGVSADGRFVVFFSIAQNLTNGDPWPPNDFDVFLRDRQNATTECLSLTPGGMTGNSHSTYPTISGDGQYVAFVSDATDFLPLNTDTNGKSDIYLWERSTNTKRRVSLSSGGVQSNGQSGYSPSLSADGRIVAFTSSGTNLVPADTNGKADAFVRLWQDGTATTMFTSLCDPGVDGVIDCPCANPPAALARGCDNSASTGGANLAASGNTELTADGLAFTVTGAKPFALSLLAQGNALIASGLVYGQGVRCLGGAIKRITWTVPEDPIFVIPDLPAGDLPISERSAQAGDPILPGQSRWYLVYYRDSIVLGGCPPTSTFNATQAGEVTWLP